MTTRAELDIFVDKGDLAPIYAQVHKEIGKELNIFPLAFVFVSFNNIMKFMDHRLKDDRKRKIAARILRIRDLENKAEREAIIFSYEVLRHRLILEVITYIQEQYPDTMKAPLCYGVQDLAPAMTFYREMDPTEAWIRTTLGGVQIKTCAMLNDYYLPRLRKMSEVTY